MKFFTCIFVLFYALTIRCYANGGVPVNRDLTLIAEDFSEGSQAAINTALNNSIDPIWQMSPDSSPYTFEGFPNTGANARGFSNQYDPGTGLVDIPGALEVNASLSDMTFVSRIPALPTNLDTSVTAILSFFAGIRAGVDPGLEPTVRVFNFTDSMDVYSETMITGLNTGTDNTTTEAWVLKSYEVTFGASDLGDEILVEWNGGGNDPGEGLLLVDINFLAASIPEPPTYTLITGSLALTPMAFRRILRSPTTG